MPDKIMLLKIGISLALLGVYLVLVGVIFDKMSVCIVGVAMILLVGVPMNLYLLESW